MIGDAGGSRSREGGAKDPSHRAMGDPLAAGLVTNLARPRGMVTGVSNVVADVSEKYLELLLEAVPTLRRAGFLSDPGLPSHAGFMDTVRRSIAPYSIEGQIEPATTPEEIEPGENDRHGYRNRRGWVET